MDVITARVKFRTPSLAPLSRDADRMLTTERPDALIFATRGGELLDTRRRLRTIR
jgi:hypothetical protein